MKRTLLIVAAVALVAAGGAYAGARLRTVRLRPGHCTTVGHVRVCARTAPVRVVTRTVDVAVTPPACRLAMQDVTGLVGLYQQSAGDAKIIVEQAEAVIAGQPSNTTAVNTAAAELVSLNSQIANATAGYNVAATECARP